METKPYNAEDITKLVGLLLTDGTEEEVMKLVTSILADKRVKIRVGYLPFDPTDEQAELDLDDPFLRYSTFVVEVGNLAYNSTPRLMAQAFYPVYETSTEQVTIN